MTSEQRKYTQHGRKPGDNNNECTNVPSAITPENQLLSDNNNSRIDPGFFLVSYSNSGIIEESLEEIHKMLPKVHCALVIPVEVQGEITDDVRGFTIDC